MDTEKQQERFEDKYQQKLGTSFEEWYETAPHTESEAYEYCKELDEELKNTYEAWFNATGDERSKLEDYRDRLKLEYDIVEELFGLELHDR